MADDNVMGSVSGWQTLTGKEIRVELKLRMLRARSRSMFRLSSKLFPAICKMEANVPISQMNTVTGYMAPSD